MSFHCHTNCWLYPISHVFLAYYLNEYKTHPPYSHSALLFKWELFWSIDPEGIVSNILDVKEGMGRLKDF